MVEQSSIKLVAGVFALLLLAVPLVMTSSFAAEAGSTAAKAGIMVPLYTYPGGTWNTVVDTKNAHPDLPIAAIVNPASGPGSSKDSNYVTGIAKLKSAGVVVLGYVSTAYTNRDLGAVKTDIDRWKSWYPDVGGIFFDEQTNWAGPEWYYNQADDYAKSKGFTFTVGNPGANSIPSYLDTVDVVLIYESPGLPNLNNYQSWSSADNAKLGMIPFGVGSLPTTWINNAANLVGWIYVTNDVLPNPWDSLPPYFKDMAALLDSGSAPSLPLPKYTLTIRSVDQNGNALNGMWMEVKKGGATVSTGFTPLTLTLEQVTYTVSAGNYQQIIFDHWSDGSRSSTISVNLSGNTVITAHYNNGSIKPLSVVLSADRTSLTAGQSVIFSASLQGGTAPYSWSVNFGDGSASPFGTSPVTKAYSAPGTYSAVATARDASGKTAASSPVAITVSALPSALTVKSADLAGNEFAGMWTVVQSGSSAVKTGFTPLSHTAASGTYTVTMSDYQNFVFDHWEDGSKSRTRTVSMAGQPVNLKAYYSTGPREVSLTIKSVGLDGREFSGMWTVVSSGSSTVKTGFTPLAHNANAGTQYTVTMSDYQNFVFDHWEDGSKSRTRTITPNSNAVLTAYYWQ